jgi:FkbM family methyltransferase
VFLRRHFSDFIVFEEIFIDKIYKFNFKVSDSPIIIDAGANVSYTALFFLKMFPKAKIFCIEPNIENSRLLKQNLNGYRNITLINKGLWNTNVHLKFESMEASSWAFQVIECNENESQCEAISINQIIEEYKLDKIDILKMDIEGSEKEVFENNNNWINITHQIIIEIHENMHKGAEDAVFSLTNSHDFEYKFLNSNYFFTKK